VIEESSRDADAFVGSGAQDGQEVDRQGQEGQECRPQAHQGGVCSHFINFFWLIHGKPFAIRMPLSAQVEEVFCE